MSDNFLLEACIREINLLKTKVAALESAAAKQKQPKWIRVNADLSVNVGEGLKAVQIAVDSAVWRIEFTTPRADTKYAAVANVYHPHFWRTWPRVHNITATGFDVHFLTESNDKISSVYGSTPGRPPLELAVVVVEDQDN